MFTWWCLAAPPCSSWLCEAAEWVEDLSRWPRCRPHRWEQECTVFKRTKTVPDVNRVTENRSILGFLTPSQPRRSYQGDSNVITKLKVKIKVTICTTEWEKKKKKKKKKKENNNNNKTQHNKNKRTTLVNYTINA